MGYDEVTATLVRDEEGLALRSEGGRLVRAAVEHLRAPRAGRDLLGRAVKAGLKAAAQGRQATEQPEVIDATAGLGADSFHLAAVGLQVTMVERVPEVADLLADALQRAAAGSLGEAARAAGARLRLERGDAREVLAEQEAAGRRPAVVYLDPMYPKQAKAALPGKGMALFRDLVGGDADAAALLTVARGCVTRRVVVKRPLKAPHLGGQEPTGSLLGKTTRYDLYAPLVARGGGE